MTTDQLVDCHISFDTTGSMYPCLTQVRRSVRELVQRLFRDIPGIRIGVTAHGDYCDAGRTYVTSHQSLSNDANRVVRFIETVAATDGGDSPECYELVLNEARNFPWRHNATRILVLIGDDIPHAPAQNPRRLNWRDEVNALGAAGVAVYGVQALNRSHATQFYKELAHISGGYHLVLEQFSQVTDLLLGIGYRQVSEEKFVQYAQEVQDQGRMNRGLATSFSTMSPTFATTTAKTYREAPRDLRAVDPSRFQILHVDHDCPIKDFVERNGLTFQPGRGFYEFMKPETVQDHKEVVLVSRKTGDIFSGAEARNIAGLPHGFTAKLKPTALKDYRVFIQSTSNNRKLINGTGFLYEVS